MLIRALKLFRALVPQILFRDVKRDVGVLSVKESLGDDQSAFLRLGVNDAIAGIEVVHGWKQDSQLEKLSEDVFEEALEVLVLVVAVLLDVASEAHQGGRRIILSVGVFDCDLGCDLLVVVVHLKDGFNLADAWVAVEAIDLLET